VVAKCFLSYGVHKSWLWRARIFLLLWTVLHSAVAKLLPSATDQAARGFRTWAYPKIIDAGEKLRRSCIHAADCMPAAFER
jgi:hypothetical protein